MAVTSFFSVPVEFGSPQNLDKTNNIFFNTLGREDAIDALAKPLFCLPEYDLGYELPA